MQYTVTTPEQRIAFLEQRVKQLEIIVCGLVPALDKIHRATHDKMLEVELQMTGLAAELLDASAGQAKLVPLLEPLLKPPLPDEPAFI